MSWGELGVIVATALVTAFFPLALIWSMNTLFGTGIAYGWSTWLATWLLTGCLSLVFTSTTTVVVNGMRQ